MYIGQEPATSFTGLIKQDFTVSATASYTLSHSVNSSVDIALYRNFVRQEPETAYSCTGTSLTLTSATVSGDDLYCIYLGQALQTVNPANNSVGITQLNVSDGSSGQALTTNGSGALSFTSVGGVNTPAFESYLSANADISNATDTKINCNTEVLDTASAYDNSSNFRFTVPSGQAGKYYIYASVVVQTTGGVSTNRFGVGKLYKNGSIYRQQYLSYENNNGFSTIHNISAIMDLSVGDYIELYFYGSMSSGVPRVRADDKGTYLGGYKIIE